MNWSELVSTGMNSVHINQTTRKVIISSDPLVADMQHCEQNGIRTIREGPEALFDIFL